MCLPLNWPTEGSITASIIIKLNEEERIYKPQGYLGYFIWDNYC